MLSSLLPGLRDFRTPFVTGCLYLLLAWLALGGERLVPANHPGNAMQRLNGLIGLLGSTVTLGAVALIAYLLGSLLVVNPEALTRRSWFHLPFGVEMWLSEIVSESPLSDWSPGRVVETPDLLGRKLTHIYADAFHDRYADGGPESTSGALTYALKITLASEFRTLLVRLQIERESLYQEYDRRHSEAQLRLSISPPLAMIFVALAFLSGPWWLVGLALPGVLVWQGSRMAKSAMELVWGSLTMGVIASPSIETFREASLAVQGR